MLRKAERPELLSRPSGAPETLPENARPGCGGLMALTLVSPAGAAEPSKLVSFLAGERPGEGKTFACFVRNYDGAHLARHPQ